VFCACVRRRDSEECPHAHPHTHSQHPQSNRMPSSQSSHQPPFPIPNPFTHTHTHNTIQGGGGSGLPSYSPLPTMKEKAAASVHPLPDDEREEKKLDGLLLVTSPFISSWLLRPPKAKVDRYCGPCEGLSVSLSSLSLHVSPELRWMGAGVNDAKSDHKTPFLPQPGLGRRRRRPRW
jgi:hypothetical protein